MENLRKLAYLSYLVLPGRSAMSLAFPSLNDRQSMNFMRLIAKRQGEHLLPSSLRQLMKFDQCMLMGTIL